MSNLDWALQAKQELAERAVAKLLSTDNTTRTLGMELVSLSPGQAVLSMTIRKDMVNGHNTAHGGMIFTLADSALACACNSHNITNVAQSCQINFVRPALLGDKLTAHARELSRGRRSGLYDVVVHNQHDKPVAFFRAQSASLNTPLVKA